jgi:hypothetical protein
MEERKRKKRKDRDPESYRRECAVRTKREEEKSLSRRTRSSAETVIFIAQVGFNP